MILSEKEVEVHYGWDETEGIEEEPKKKEIKVEEKKELEKPKEEEGKKKKTKKKEVKKENKKEEKKKNKKKIKIKTFLILALITLLIAVVLVFVNIDKILPKTQDKTINIAAIVNGEIISLEDLDKQYDKLSSQEKSIVPKEFLLEVIIDNKLLLQKADEKNIIVTDNEIDSEINRLKTQFPSEESFNQFLESQGMTSQKLKEITIEQLKIKKILDQEAFKQITVTDSEIKKYYEENTDQFKAKEGEIRAAHILVNTTEQAEDILKKIKSGSDFKTLAKEYSTGPSAVNEGELGFFGKGVMIKEFEDAAFALKEGEVSGIVKTQYGYHIIKRESDVIPLEEVKSQINQSLLFSKQRAVFTTYMDQLRAQSNVKIYYGNFSGEIELPEEVETPKELIKETFTQTNDEICEEDGKPIIRLYSTTTCPHCNWIKEGFDSVVKEYMDKGLIKAYHWQLDSGDDILTTEVETKIPKTELGVFKKCNPSYTVPTFVFGCKYYRIGNAYEASNDLESEKKNFKKIINELVS